MRTAICISGLARTFVKTCPAFVRDMLEPLKRRGQVDIFVSIWDTEGLFGGDGIDLTYIRDLYQPLAMDVESFTPLKGFFQLVRYLDGPKQVLAAIVKDGVLLSMPAQYKVARCNALKRHVEQVGRFRYDLVIRTRFDMEVSPICVDTLDMNRINCLYDHDGLMGDYLYMGSSEKMDLLCDLFNHYYYLLNLPDTDMGPERNLKNYANTIDLSTKVMERYTYALVRDTQRDEFHWDGVDYRPKIVLTP